MRRTGLTTITDKRTRLLGGALAALCCTAATTMAQTTHTVAASGGGDFTTIAAAIAAASSGDTIRIIESPHTENNITINKSLTIEGWGADQTTLQAHADRLSAANRVFNMSTAGIAVTLKDMTIRHGKVDGRGGCINVTTSNPGPDLTILRCAIRENDCTGADAQGAGVNYYNPTAGGSLTILDSTFANNVSANTAAYQGGAALNVGTIDSLLIRNSTFSGNIAYKVGDWTHGGGLIITPDVGLIQNCSFVANGISGGTSCGGGAIRANDKVTAESCLFADNFCGNTGYGSDMYDVLYTNTVYEGTVYSSTALGVNNLKTVDAKIDTNLADNGGPTPTHALLAGSPAIDAGSNTAGLSFDQRGTGYLRTINSVTDCGAFEYLAGPITLAYVTDAFNEHTGLNNGSIDNAIPMVITLIGNETFAASINVGTEVLVSNLPAGLTAVFTRDSATQLSVTLTGQATNHGDGDDVADLEFAFQGSAFAGNDASAVGNTTKSDLKVDFINAALPPELTYNGSGFVEAAANDGSIATTWTVDLANGDFAGAIGTNYVLGGEVVVSNLPAGLTAVVQKSDVREVTVSLTGNAAAHNVADGIANLTLDFQDEVLASGDASALVNDPRNNLTISYIDPVLTYNGSGAFTEAAVNDGSIGNSFTITLVGDSFTGSVNDDFADGSGEVTVSSPPAGLAWRVNRDSATQLTVSFTGNATAQNVADSVTGLTLSFNDSAFTASTAAVVTNTSKSNYSITFLNPTLSYSATSFYESSDNDGTVPDTTTITLAGDTFPGSNGDDFAGDEVSVANVPSGLTAKLTRTSPTSLAASFTGTAAPHDAGANRSDVTFTFQNSAFVGNNASIVANSTKSDLSVLFRESYFVNQATGNDANDGSAGAPWSSLTNAVVKAPANSVISIMHSPHTENSVNVTKGMVFRGLGADQTILQANASPWTGSGRVFTITAAGASTVIQDMTVRHGRMTGTFTSGGAVHCSGSGSSLTLTRCIFELNEAEYSGGGAVRTDGVSLTVRDSTFRQNIAIHNGYDAAGGAIHASNGRGISIANSTFSANSAWGSYGWDGGGGAVYASPAAGYTAGIYNCTFYSNSLPVSDGQGGAIRGGGRNNTTVYSCVFAKNNIAGSVSDTVKGSSMSHCAFTNSVYEDAYVTAYPTMYNLGGNISTNNAGLNPVLAANGGSTPTHALLAGSAAIDTGINPLGLIYDQRGKPFERVYGEAADCGAYEFGAGKPVGTIMILR